MEIWKDVSGYEGFYQVSNTGKIKSLSRKIQYSVLRSQAVSKPERILTQTMTEKGYLVVYLSKDGIDLKKKVHRIVAEHFCDNPETVPEVNHIDGNKSNNYFENLEWASRLQNMRHASSTGLLAGRTVPLGENHSQSKLKESDIPPIRFRRAVGEKLSSIAKDLGVSPGTICDVIKRRTWSHIP